MAAAFRFALRSLWSSRALSAAAVAVLALGSGASTAIFAVVNAVLVRPLPVRDEATLAFVSESLSGRRGGKLAVSAPAFQELRTLPAFLQVEAVGATAGNLELGDRAEPVTVSHATDELLPLLGVEMRAGRAFTARDGDDVALVSEALWRAQLREDPQLVGRSIAVDGRQRRVLGVVPGRLAALFPGDVWVPLRFTPEQLGADRREYGFVQPVARLAAAPAEAQRQLDALAAQLRDAHPESGRAGFQLTSFREALSAELRPSLLLLLTSVALLLLATAANAANLLLARAAQRQRELAVRAALGADRFALARQLVTEGLVLAAFGCAAGLLIALWAIELLAPAGSDVIRRAAVEVDGRVLVFALVSSALAGVAASLVPALQATRPDVHTQLKDGARRLTSGARRRVRDALVVLEVAVALVLCAVAGHAAVALRVLLRVDPGFEARDAAALEVSLPPARYPDADAQRRFFDSLAASSGGGFVAAVPLTGAQLVWHFDVEGPQGRGSGHVVEPLQVFGPGARAALGIPLLRGADGGALVNAAFARRYWPGEEAVGKRIRPWTFRFEDAAGRRFWPGGGAWLTVTGVVGDVREAGLSVAPRPEIVVPLAAFPLPEGAIVARGASLARLRAALVGLDPQLAAQRLAPLEKLVASSAAPRRDAVLLLAALALLTLLLAGMGLYAALAWEVAERRRELSIRMALGADSARVLRLVVMDGLRLAALGVGTGALALPLVVRALPAAPSRLDLPLTLALALALLAVLFAAALLPARRAARIDPRLAFRVE